MADQLEQPSPSGGGSEDYSKRVQVAMKIIKSMGLNQEMLRSIITSWLVPQFRPEITTELGQSLTRIQDVGFSGISSRSPEGLRPYRMFDIADRMLVNNIDPSAPYCMVSHRWKDPEINLDLLRKSREDVANSYPVWYNTDRNDVEIILKYCKEKIQQQRKDINGCAAKNRLDERLLRKGCYVLSLLKMHHQSKKVNAEVSDAHAHLEKTIHDKKVVDMENRIFKDLSNKAKDSNGENANGVSSADADKHQSLHGNSDEDGDSVKAAYERVFEAEWERDKHSDDLKFDSLGRDLREAVEGMIRCLRLWRSAIKIEQSIIKAGEIFDRGMIPGQKQQKSYVWLDICCIDKSNHNEHSESMSLMGDWYAQSAFTLVHLDTGFDKSPKGSDAEIYWHEFLQADGDYQKLESLADRELDQVQNYEDIANESEIEWSTRGWTLQELVMSRMTYYVNADWKFLHRPVENLGRAYHLIPYIDLYTNPLDVKPTPNAWRPEVLMTALLNSGTVLYTDAIKALYPRIELEDDENEVEDGFSLSNALLASIAMPWNLMDTMFHVTKPEPSQSDEVKIKLSRDALLREISVLWDQTLASGFPQIETSENDKAKPKNYKINEHSSPQSNLSAEDKVLHALSIIKALELVGFCFPKDMSLETAKAEMAQSVFFAAMGLIECYEQTQYPIVIQQMPMRENNGKKASDGEEKARLKLKKQIEKRVKLEMRKKLFEELLNSFPEAKKHYSIETIEGPDEKEEAISKTLAYVLHALVDEVKSLVQEDRQYIAEFGNITLLEPWIEGTQRYGFTTQEVMTLACERKTTKSFDRAYSLMGILGVRFPTFPAEGYQKALCRLLDETITTHNDVSVFNWTGYSKGSSMRGRSMYPSTQEAYKAKGGQLHSRNSMSKVMEDNMSRTTKFYHAIVSLLRDTIDFLKKHTPTKQEVEWIQHIVTIVHYFQLDKLRALSIDRVNANKPRSHVSVEDRTDALPYEIEILSKFIGYIINGPKVPVLDASNKMQGDAANKRENEAVRDPALKPVPDLAAYVHIDNSELCEQMQIANANQDAAPVGGVSPPTPPEAPLPVGNTMDGPPPVGRKSRFVELLSEVGPTPVPPPMVDAQDKSQNGTEAASEKDEITTYLQNWVASFSQGMKDDNMIPKDELPAKVRGIRYKVEKQNEESYVKKTSSFGSSSMISPHPIIVTNAGIEGIFDIQRVIITMANLQGLWQQVEHTTSSEQIISGYCSISTGFAQVIVRFSCKSGLLKKQLEVIDGIDFSVMKEQNKQEGKKREHKMASKVIWDKKKKDKKDKEEREGEKKKKKKDKQEANENNLEGGFTFSGSLDDTDNNDAMNEVSEGQQTRDVDEEKTIDRMIKFIQEEDLRLVAGEWVLARCSGVADANWFLCHLELGSTHPFYGYRIPTSEIDFSNCIPEDGLVLAWNTYTNRKKEEMCNILTMLIKSKERKLKRRRLVGRILRDLAPLDEKAEQASEEPRASAVARNGINEDPDTHAQNDYDCVYDNPQRGDMGDEADREIRPNLDLYSQESTSSVLQDDMWSAAQDPQSQYSTTSVEAQQDIWLNQEIRPEDSVSNVGDQDARPSQQPPPSRDSTVTTKGAEDDEKSHFWDYLPFIEKVAETKANHFDKHLSATVLKDTPTVLRQAIENLNDNRDFLPAMFHSAKKIHMF
ncbi:hypothetical protein Trco_007281 [Trichoderma cornu-damae]|uniref:Heterokaryon incompatibility domain-containing protein n=1 Tax=Trichoderma cornu-damae TaxID=654480 RepID=A0A9P8QFL0_9HYPO|nr:hypothetical protein Trco_007281 [Trichoderma cornu-damae]